MADAVIGSLVFEMRANAARLNTDLGKVTGDFKKMEREIKGIGKNLGTIFKAAFAITGVVAIKSMTAQLVELAKRGEVAGSIAENFEKLGGDSGAISKAREATLGMVSAFDLMAIASKAILKGVPEVNENFVLLSKYGAQLADTFGGDTKASIEAVTEALAKVNDKALLAVGITIDTDKAYQKYADTMGIVKTAGQRWSDVLTEQQQKLAKQAEFLVVAKQRTEQLAPVTTSVANAQEAFGIALQDAAAQMGIGINNSDGLATAYLNLSNVINSIDWKELGANIGNFASIAANLANDILPILTRGFDMLVGGNATKIDVLAREWQSLNAELEKAKKLANQAVEVGGFWNPSEEQGARIIKTRQEAVKKLEEQTKIAYNNYWDFLKLLDSKDKGKAGPVAITAEVKKIETAVKELKQELEAPKIISATRGAADKSMQEYGDAFQDAMSAAVDGDWSRALSGIAQHFGQDISDSLGNLVDAEQIGNIGAGIGTILSATIAQEIKGNNTKTGGIAGSILGGAIGGATGGAPGFMIGTQLGGQLGGIIGGAFKTGLTNAESKARVEVEQWLEDVFAAAGNVRFFDKDGALAGIFDGNIVGKAFTDTFNQPGWVDNMDVWGDKAKGVFLGLGEAIKEVRGITEDVGDQIGFILGSNLSGNIDNARLLVQQLGLSFEEMSEALLQSAMKGQISWLEFNSYIRDTAEAFKPGLEATGAIQQAFQSLIDSGGQGREALKGFKDTAIEAMEAGATTIEDLRTRLIEQGFDPALVEATIQAAAQRGVKTLEAWASTTDATAGAIVGDMEAMSESLRTTWEEMRETLKGFKEDLESIPKSVSSEINLKVKTEYDNATREVMDSLGGALPSGIPGEETISSGFKTSAMKLSGASKKLAPSGGYKYTGKSTGPKMAAAQSNVIAPSINIDARGAAPGVEGSIRRAIAEVESKILANVASAIAQSRMRGGRASDSY